MCGRYTVKAEKEFIDSNKQEKLVERYLQYLSTDNVINLLNDINPSLVEKKVCLSTIEEIEKKIGYKGSVTFEVYLKFLSLVFEKVKLDLSGSSFKIYDLVQNTRNRLYYDVIMLILRLYLKEALTPGHTKITEEEYHLISSLRSSGSGFNPGFKFFFEPAINIGDIVRENAVARIISRGPSMISIETLSKIFEIKKILVENHRQLEIPLDEILSSPIIKQ